MLILIWRPNSKCICMFYFSGFSTWWLFNWPVFRVVFVFNRRDILWNNIDPTPRSSTATYWNTPWNTRCNNSSRSGQQDCRGKIEHEEGSFRVTSLLCGGTTHQAFLPPRVSGMMHWFSFVRVTIVTTMELLSSHWNSLLGGSQLIHFRQLRRFLRSLDGSTWYWWITWACHTHPCAVILLHNKASEYGTNWDLVAV